MSASSTQKRPLLIVEDDQGLQNQLKWSFEGYTVHLASDRDEALALLRRHEPPVVTLDLGLPPDPANASEGLRALEEIIRLAPSTKVIVVTGNDEKEAALAAIEKGAYDFYQKPIDPDVLGLTVERAFRLHELEMENRRLGATRHSSPLDGVITASAEMHRVCRIIEKVGPTSATVLLLGESGTGKELLARALHNLSPRKEDRFVVINCAAIPETLLESELFGYEKGAFTGANKRTIGKLEYADGGTLFLDEIGDLPLSLQAKLLRFLQERVLERVGGREEIPVDVRVISATHQNLQEKIGLNEYREDLFYRISEVTVNIPPLRDRGTDVVLLARAFLERAAKAQGRSLRGFTSDALASIQAYPWPGNAREVENRVKRGAIMTDGNTVGVEDLEIPSVDEAPKILNLRQVRERAERHAVVEALAYCENKVSQAAELLGVTRPTLYVLMEKFGLK